MSAPIISINALHKSYVVTGAHTPILQHVNVTVEKGEFVAVLGRSGSGKSTFLNILGLLDQPDAGTYQLNGIDTRHVPEDGLAALRNKHIGFVFQNFNLISGRSILENVSLPLLYAGIPLAKRKEMARSYLDLVNLGDYGDRRPNQLSGGQQQRAAIARALINNPSLLLADEPTGSLDSTTAEDIMEIFSTIHSSGVTIVLVTHDLTIAGKADRFIYFRDGQAFDR